MDCLIHSFSETSAYTLWYYSSGELVYYFEAERTTYDLFPSKDGEFISSGREASGQDDPSRPF